MILIRNGRDADAAVIAAIHRDSRAAAMPWLPKLHTPEEDLFFFESSVMKSCEVYIAQSEERLLGFCAVRDTWIDHLYIRPENFQQSCGTQLLDRAKLGRSELHLWCFQRNEVARRFYEKRGFKPVELTDGRLNEEKEPDVRYAWSAHQPAYQGEATRI